MHSPALLAVVVMGVYHLKLVRDVVTLDGKAGVVWGEVGWGRGDKRRESRDDFGAYATHSHSKRTCTFRRTSSTLLHAFKRNTVIKTTTATELLLGTCKYMP